LPSNPQASQALRRLLETKLDTFEKLELVLVLQKSGPTSVADLVRELQVGHDVMLRLVGDVVRTGLVELSADDTVRLVAGPAELEVIAEGAQLYAFDRSKVITLFSAIAMDRIRSMAARSFADAFQIRKKKGEDDG
jgi:hypothetical protein